MELVPIIRFVFLCASSQEKTVICCLEQNAWAVEFLWIIFEPVCASCLSSKFILRCLLSKNGSGPFNHLAFDSRHVAKLCQWRALETRCSRSFPSWFAHLSDSCSARQSAAPRASISPFLTSTGSFIMKSFCRDTSPWTAFPSTLKGRFPANSTSVALRQFLCIYSVSLPWIWAMPHPAWSGLQPFCWEPLPWASVYLSSWASGCSVYLVFLWNSY